MLLTRSILTRSIKYFFIPANEDCPCEPPPPSRGRTGAAAASLGVRGRHGALPS